jgi:hypothetical protein
MNDAAQRDQIATSIKGWIVGVGIGVSCAFLAGCWTISSQVTALTTAFQSYVISNNQRMDRIERLEDGHFRGVP